MATSRTVSALIASSASSTVFCQAATFPWGFVLPSSRRMFVSIRYFIRAGWYQASSSGLFISDWTRDVAAWQQPAGQGCPRHGRQNNPDMGQPNSAVNAPLAV
ncbi:hypothetical protein [Bradyrhizobium sp.]|uniref:hypothetical protein n=1 Tax=Bradyrhizobium sp. TaxID=376 RepID=UPI003C37501C